MKGNKRKKVIILTIIILAALTAGIFFFLGQSGGTSSEFKNSIKEEQLDISGENNYRFDTGKQAEELALSGEGKNVLNFHTDDPFNINNSTNARKRLDRVIKRVNSTLQEPIIAKNPFGTNENSFYFNFQTSFNGMVRYRITVDDEKIPDIIRYVNNGKENNLSNQHEFTVGGFVPGKKNYLVIEVLDSSGLKREEKIYSYQAKGADMPIQFEFKEGNSKSKAVNGFYFLFPLGKKYIYMYDNSGILRNCINTESNHGKMIYKFGDNVVYQVSDKKIVRVSSIGRVTGVADIKGYDKIDDFAYDGYGNVYSLVEKKNIQFLIGTSLETSKTKRIFKFPKKLKLFALSSISNGSIYATCKNSTAIIKMKALTSQKPRIDFILGNRKGLLKLAKKYNKKIKDEKNLSKWNTCQSRLNIIEDESNGTTDVFSAYIINDGKGMGIKFKLDCKNKKIEKVSTYPVGYGGDSDCACIDGHYIISNKNKGIYTEYDEAAKIYREFKTNMQLDNLVKLSLNSMCFYNGD